MSEFRFACPHCSQRMSGDDTYRGMQVTCPNCQQTFTVPNPAARAAIPSSSGHSVLPPPASAPSKMSALALLSLVCSVGLSLGCIPAIVLGHLARSRMRRNPLLTGKPLALAGLVIGYCMLALTAAASVATLVVWSPKHGRQLTDAERDAVTPAILSHRLVDEVKTGDPQSEFDHDLKTRSSGRTQALGRMLRQAPNGGAFSYSMKVDSSGPMTLAGTYWGNDGNNRRFDVLVNDKLIATQELQFNDPGHFFDVYYKIPESLTHGQTNVTVTFQGYPRKNAGGIFDLKMLRQ